MSQPSDQGFSIGPSISYGPGGLDIGGDLCYTTSGGTSTICGGGSTNDGGTVGISASIK